MNSDTLKLRLQGSPVIAALKDVDCLGDALKSDCEVIFMLSGSIFNLREIVNRVHSSGKLIFIHVDLIDGFSRDSVALDYINSSIHPDGIISTKCNLIKTARELGIMTVQRFFIIDSMSLENAQRTSSSLKPDAIEIMPGIMPSITQKLADNCCVPLIAGGLIDREDDVSNALAAGAVGVSTTAQQLWRKP